MSLFITGTDTGVGKTYLAAGLLRAARARGWDAVGWKPFCCGERDDAEALRTAGEDRLTLEEVNPVWFRPPVAPYTAAIIENRLPDLALVLEVGRRLARTHRLVLGEGAGGWAVPILRDYRMSDLARDLGWPVLVVAANRLGALNHILLTVEAVRAAGLPCLGVVLNQVEADQAASLAPSTNAGILETLLEIPIWEQPFGEAVGRVCRVLEQC